MINLQKQMVTGCMASALLVCLVLAGCGDSSKIAQDAKELEAFETAKDAYIYAYPLVTMEFTRRVGTNVVAPEGVRGPMGQLIKLRIYPDAKFNAVTAPNADTLYTVVFLDVWKEPWVINIPDLKGRYALFPMLDGCRMYSKSPASARQAQEHRSSPSLDPAGTERFPLESQSTSHRREWCGSWAASTAPGRQKITRQSMRFKMR
jgi:hypothetical protein